MRALLFLLLLAAPAFAADLAVQEFEVDGVPVLLRRNPDTPVVAAALFLRGGSQNLTPANAGLEQLALAAATQGGTATWPKDEFHRRMASLGSQIGTAAYADLSQITVRAVRPKLEETWDLVSSVLLEPSFPAAEVDLARRQQLATVRAERENPDAALRNLAEESFYAGHPYALRPLGTEATLAGFDAAEVAAYYRSLLNRGRLLAVFVGDVDRPTVEALLRRSTSRLPAGAPAVPPVPPSPAGSAPGRLEVRALPTWYVRGTFAAPSPGQEGHAALALAAEVLSDRLFREARTERNLVYSIYSAVSGRAANYGIVYFTSTKPAEVLAIVREEVRRLASEPLTEEDLQAQVSVFLTQRWMSEASASDQAQRLGHAEIVAGDWRHADDFVRAVRALTPAELQDAARHMQGARFVLLGPAEGLDAPSFRL